MADKRENYDLFPIPRNFGEDGISFNGLSRRNLVEGAILAIATGYPLFRFVPASMSMRVILLCFISLPLFFFGLVGMGGESLSQYVVTVFRWLITHRKLRYYIDQGEEEAPKEKLKGLAAVKALFRKRDKDAIQYRKIRPPKPARRKGGKKSLFDRVFPSKKTEAEQQDAEAEEAEEAPKSRQIKNQAQTFFPVADIRGGMIITRDRRYIKVVEVNPINFLLRSADEQRDIIMSFAELLRIAPVTIQFKSNANRADITKFLANTKEEIERETNPKCKELGEDYIEHIQSIATNNAISRRFFAIFEYTNNLPSYHPTEQEIRFVLESVVRNFRSYLSRCGNTVEEFDNEEEENEHLLNLFHTLLDHYNVEELSLQDKVDRAFKWRLKGDNLDEMCTADYICPDEIDLSHAKYTVIDGIYHAYLYIPSGGFKTIVGAAWLSPLINAGEAIDVDLFLHKQPSDRMQVQVSRNLRINKAKMGEVSTTSSDFNKMDDIMQSGFYLQRGLNDGQEFYYLTVLVTVKAYSKKDLDNRVNEVVKMMTAKQVQLKNCSYLQEAAFLSTLPLAKLDPKLYKLGKRNVLTNTAASTYMFTAYEICDDTGVMIGTNEHNNSLVILDLFNARKYKSPHLTIIGTTGSGKTFTLQTIATRLRRKHVRTFLICPIKGHEMKRATDAIGGEFIRLSTGSPHTISCMEIRPVDNSVNDLLDGDMEEQSMLSMKIDSLLIFFSIIMPEMTNVEQQLLDEALMRTYRDYGITTDNASLFDPDNPGQYKKMPILEDLHKHLLEEERAERLAIILNRFVNGSAQSFNRQTSVDLSNPYTVVDLTYLKGKTLLAAGMFIALDLIWDICKQNRIEQKAIIIDEAWVLMGGSSNQLAADFVVELIKVARAYNTSVIIATQDINDFLALENGKFGKAIIANSKTKIVLNLEPHEAETAGEILNLTATEIHKIKHFERGHGLLSSNGNNIAVRFQSSPTELELVTTDPDELKAIMEKKKRRLGSYGSDTGDDKTENGGGDGEVGA